MVRVPGEGELHLHMADLAQVRELAAETTAWLPQPDLKALADRYRGGRRRLAEGSRLLVRAVTGHATGSPSNAVRIVTDSWGRPRLGDGTRALRFNVSHDSGLLVLVLGTGACGIDVEDTAEDDLRAVVRRFCGAGDWALLTPRSGARQLWTAKESAAKALGRGLRAGMSSIHFASHPGLCWAAVSWRGQPAMIRTRAVDLGIRHLSVTSAVEPSAIRVRIWEPACANGRWRLLPARQPAAAMAAAASEIGRQLATEGNWNDGCADPARSA